MYTINGERIRAEIKKRGFKTLGDFADNIGLHRNMVSYYLASKSVLPDGLGRILDSLDLSLEEAVLRNEKSRQFGLRDVSPLVDQLHAKYPNNIFVLFGSRACGKHVKYSDFDIGTYSEKGTRGEEFLTMLTIKSDFEDSVPFFVDLVNLNNTDKEFLENISKDWQLLAGKLSTWTHLHEKIK